MLLWEGGTFFILLILISSTFIFLYIKDLKKNRAMAIFFSSLTHELKTPLASIRLQADVIHDLLTQSENQMLKKLSERMIEDTGKLEIQMDKILQLSRMELGGNLNPTSINLDQFIKQIKNQWAKDFEIKIETKCKDLVILADEFALELIFKNLIENTRRHTSGKKIIIQIEEGSSDSVFIKYTDAGIFSGDKKRVGSLFYKHDSSKGSGIGLYLIKRLMEKMKGGLSILFEPKFTFILNFKKLPGMINEF